MLIYFDASAVPRRDSADCGTGDKSSEGLARMGGLRANFARQTQQLAIILLGLPISPTIFVILSCILI
ncbi:MAG: hypothetical protein EB015_01900 [Methylocystaceae bacterium]|nr:hypothetical protein [Methylocystaceae bacterium]